MSDKLVTACHYCICGAAWKYSNMPSDEATRICAAWHTAHSGPGHAPCDARTARRARLVTDYGADMSDHDVDAAYKWARNQNYQSVAARYAKTLAVEVERLNADLANLRRAHAAEIESLWREINEKQEARA